MAVKKYSFPNVSFVIPAYNTAGVIEGCLDAILDAINKVDVKAWEVIVADDGSKDNTPAIIKDYAKKMPVRVVKLGGNKGRIAARKAGIDKTKYDLVILIDTKTVLNDDAFVFLSQQFAKHPERQVWCPHVDSDVEGNLVAAFNEGMVRLIWRRYMDKPRLVGFDISEFDYYPKGGTCIVVPKALLLESYKQFNLDEDLKFASDDIPLLRYISRKTKIWLSPDFRCFYRARTGMNQFIKWIYSRGKLFTDGHLRRGTRFGKYIIALLLAPIVYVVVSILWWPFWLSPIVIWLLAMAILGLRLPRRNWLAIVYLSWIYAVSFIAGLYAGSWAKLRGQRTSLAVAE